MALDKIARMLQRRPPAGRFREQLFWLVDVIYACKASGEQALVAQAQLVEEALGRLGEFLETGDNSLLDEAMTRIEAFARIVKSAVSVDQPKE
jgi:hypothetical protein